MHQRLLYELELPDKAAAAATALRDFPGGITAAALEALLTAPPSAAAALAAWETYLAHEELDPTPLAERLCTCRFTSVRLQAIDALSTPASLPTLAQLLRNDPAWTVRQAAIKRIAAIATEQASRDPASADDPREICLIAIDDPHWRVRNDLLQVLIPWSAEESSLLETLMARFGERESPIVQGFLYYLRFVLSPGEGGAAALPEEAPALTATEASWWSDDPPVLRERLAELTPPEVRKALPLLLPLLTHPDAGVRRLVAKGIKRHGDVDTFVWLLKQLDEPRTPYLLDMATPLLRSRNDDQREAIAKRILGWGAETGDDWPAPIEASAALCWALSQPLLEWCDDLTEAGGAALTSRLMNLSQSEEPAACIAAIQALAQVWDIPGGAAENVMSAVTWVGGFLSHPSDPDGTVGVAAWQLLQDKCDASLLGDVMPPPAPRSLVWEEALAQHHLATRAPLGPDEWARWGMSHATSLRRVAAEILVAHQDAIAEDAPEGAWLLVLQNDPVPAVREAALTHERAEAIWRDPEKDFAWSVRRKAARLCKRPLADLIAPPLEVLEEASAQVPTFLVPDAAYPTPHPSARALGKTGLRVAPMGISGHYGLLEEGYAQALDAGANLFFWEPNYNTQTRFFQALSPAYKHELVTLAGTFESEPAAILRDLERALYSQQLEQIKIWLIYWVRDWERLSPAVIALLKECQQAGKIHTFGMSTHHRPLALRAIQEGWDVVMVRHNAAHRGAEEAVFPAAEAAKTGLLTFNNLIYGRILHPLHQGVPAPPLAADCYRYSLSQPGVSASFTAPYSLEQLAHNLQVLDDPHLPAERRAEMQAFGAHLYRKNRLFADCVRNR